MDSFKGLDQKNRFFEGSLFKFNNLSLAQGVALIN